MKNKYLFLIATILIISGCGKNKELICTNKNDIMQMKVTVKYKSKKIDKMYLNYEYDLSSYDEKNINNFDKQNYCELIESSSDIFNGAIKDCTQNIKDKKLNVNAQIDISKLSNDDLSKNSKIEEVKSSFESAGSNCEIR